MNFCIRKNVSLGYENTMQASEAFVQQRLQEIGGSVVKWSFVLRIKFIAGRQFCASQSPTSCS